MSIKEVIKFNGFDVNLKFNLGSGIGLVDYQQEIDEITEETKEELINPVIDNEMRRFHYKNSLGATTLKFYFTNALGTVFNNSLALNGAGFSPTEIISNDNKLRNSFFILDYYDSFDDNTQTKIFTNYLTQILNGIDNRPEYRIYNDTVNQFYNWNIPKSYLNKQTGDTVIGYVKFSFYSAKDGKLSLFYNKENQSLLTPEKMYFKTTLSLDTMEWQMDFYQSTSDVLAYEVSPQNAYVNRVNDTFNNFENEKQNYPTGNTFQSTDGSYTTE